MRMTVLGAGSWGTAFAAHLCERQPTLLWARNPSTAEEVMQQHTNTRYLPGFSLPHQLRATDDLRAAAAASDVLMVAVPSPRFRTILEQLKPYILPWIPVVSLAKGFEPDSLLRMTEIIAEVLPDHPACVFTGPNLAAEVISGHAAQGAIVTEDYSVATALQAVLTGGIFRVYTNDDKVGCEVGGALANVMAIATGMAEGIGVGDSTRAGLITRGLAEISRLGVAMGGRAATFAGLAGTGDLLAACISVHSSNRYIGEQLGKGHPLQDIVDRVTSFDEAVNTATAAVKLGGRYGVSMPICCEVRQVLAGEISARHAYHNLAQLVPGREEEPG